MSDPNDDAWYDEPPRIRFSARELLDLSLSVIVLTLAFSLVLCACISILRDGRFALDEILALMPYAAIAVIPAFILHELAHKIIAQRRDMWAEFRANPIGLIGGLIVTALTGFLFAAPGAVEIVGHADRRDAGVISIVGPMVNIALAALAVIEMFADVLKPIRIASFGDFVNLIALLNIILAAFNMLPIGPLDGRKVWRWSPLAFFGIWAMIGGLTFLYAQ